jgi:hypothetical protein
MLAGFKEWVPWPPLCLSPRPFLTHSRAHLTLPRRASLCRFHPDVNRTVGAERKFMSIQQAYELLTGKAAASGTGRGSAVGDWYWDISKRHWDARRPGGAASFMGGEQQAQQQQGKPNLASQLAGLRHRAAVKHTQHSRSQQQDEQAGGSSTGPFASSSSHEQQAELQYESEMSDGVNFGGGLDRPWDEVAQEQRPRGFTATESHRMQVRCAALLCV